MRLGQVVQMMSACGQLDKDELRKGKSAVAMAKEALPHPRSSQLQRQVAASVSRAVALRSGLGVLVEEHVVGCTPIDIALPNVKLAVHCHGPTHYSTSRPLCEQGPLSYKLLDKYGMTDAYLRHCGWTVATVPFWMLRDQDAEGADRVVEAILAPVLKGLSDRCQLTTKTKH